MLAVAVEKADPLGENRRQAGDRGKALAGKCTAEPVGTDRRAGRWPGAVQEDRHGGDKIDRWMVDAFIAAHESEPSEPRSGPGCHRRYDPWQPGRTVLSRLLRPLLLPAVVHPFSGEHLLCARLRRSNIDGADGAVDELERIVGQIRQVWPTDIDHHPGRLGLLQG